MTAPYLDPARSEKTLELLSARIRLRGDLPGFSKVVNSIIGAMRGDNDREFNITKTVLSDPALTQRVLRLANSAMYSVFGLGINTVSKAVIVLGTESIGHLALGLKLIDGMSNSMPDAPGMRIELERAVLAGHIGRQVASSVTAHDVEEVVVCSMMHALGRMMAAFYLPESWSAIQARQLADPAAEAEVARDVLGLSLEEMGRVIARQWGLPTSLVDSMRTVLPKPAGEPINHAEWLATVSTVSSRCADVICQEGGANQGELSRIVGSYADMLGMEAGQILSAIATAVQTIDAEAVVTRSFKSADEEGAGPVPLHHGKPPDALQLLARGVAEMREVMPNVSTAQMLSLALETVFKGLGFSRAIAFMRNSESNYYVGRLCFGDGVQEMLDKLTFPAAYQPDVFHAAVANDKMIFVENAHDPAFSSKLPRWWKGTLATARSFMVLPLTVNRNPVGFIYGDWDLSLPASKIDMTEVAPLNELRSLLAGALEQRHHTGSAS